MLEKQVTFGRVAVPKPQAVLAKDLRERILSGDIPEGHSLPSERELVEQTGISRGAVRQALRTLSAEGLVQTTHGRSGGSTVTLPNQNSVALAISRLVQTRRISLSNLQETRELVEPFLARLAAARRTDEHLAELKKLQQQLVDNTDNFHAFALTNVAWHQTVARASGNEWLATLLSSISYGLEITIAVEEYNTVETRSQVVRIHGRINAAIEAGDPERAERSMRQHMVATGLQSSALTQAEMPSTGGATAYFSKAHRK